MKIINPATEEVVRDITVDSGATIKAKADKLARGQKQWAAAPVKYRLDCLIRFGDLVRANIDELAKILTTETGKPLQQSYNEIRGAQNRIDHLKANLEKWLGEELVFEGDTSEKIVFEPLGVIGNISAWNFPYNVGYNVFLYALACGNAVLYKPSEFATMTGLKFRDLLLQAGIPEDAFECVIGDGNVGNMLLEAKLQGYFFTGSYNTGKKIAVKLAPLLIPLQLELGGNDPLYIMDDVADIKTAAVNAAEGAFYNNGQSCCAVERIYVHQKIYDRFLKEFIEEVERYRIGDPMNEETFIGPVTRKPQIEVLLDQIADAREKGAKVLTGGKAITGKGYFMEPTVLSNVDHSMLVMKEESFGPIIGIQRVADDQEALELMKDTEYGLTSAVFSSDQGRAEKILSSINSGTAYWNCCDRVSPNVPWSGRKNSGLGTTLSYIGIRAFVQPKAYHLRK
jgi:acyl-CoA reductase-like NAD-dependent aldehyde dehydrogenase